MTDYIPKKGDFFTLACRDTTDRSYREDVFRAVAADAPRILGFFITREAKYPAQLFSNLNWVFSKASDEIVQALLAERKGDAP